MRYLPATEINVHTHARPRPFVFISVAENHEHTARAQLPALSLVSNSVSRRFSTMARGDFDADALWPKWKWTIPPELSQIGRNRQSNSHVVMSSLYTCPLPKQMKSSLPCVSIALA